MDHLIQAIQDGQAMAVSNGMFKDQAGAAAWTIEGRTATDRLWGTGLTLGQLEDQSVYQSKLFGLWSILASLKQLVETHHIKYGQVTIACDSKAALKKAQQEYPTEPSEAHYDLISAIQNLRKVIPLTLKFEHIKGHQDQGMTMVLPHLAWMNINMDLQAKQALSAENQTACQEKIPFKGWTCLIEGRQPTKHLTENLCRHLNGKNLLNYWWTKGQISQQTEQIIDWKSVDKAMKALPAAKRQWVSKAATKFLPDGKNMQRWGLQSQAKCP